MIDGQALLDSERIGRFIETLKEYGRAGETYYATRPSEIPQGAERAYATAKLAGKLASMCLDDPESRQTWRVMEQHWTRIGDIYTTATSWKDIDVEVQKLYSKTMVALE